MLKNTLLIIRGEGLILIDYKIPDFRYGSFVDKFMKSQVKFIARSTMNDVPYILAFEINLYMNSVD